MTEEVVARVISSKAKAQSTVVRAKMEETGRIIRAMVGKAQAEVIRTGMKEV